MRLFRAVSVEEKVDIVTVGYLRPGPPSYQGKWMATTLEHARQWGRALSNFTHQPFVVAELEVPDDQLAQLFRLDNLDGIGPAYFAEESRMSMIKWICFHEDD